MIVAIVPAYNEEARIGCTVRSLFGHVDSVVVIDDGSGDNSRLKAREAGAHVLHHAVNRGQGAALQTGHEYARSNGASYVVHFDGDGQFHAEDIAPALAALKSAQVQVLLGSRYLRKGSNVPLMKKYLVHPLSKILDRVFGGLKLSDVHNGFRIIRVDALDHIVITQDRMAHASQIPQLIRKHKLSYIEHPIQVTYHQYGQSVSGGVHIVKDLLLGKLMK
ncbi:MAG: glycosyltransferase family 2 protein [Candidatus Magasanikbacteria bacterium]|jgi:polyprenyl-phospho-N-acetylgalactosaminyl synthase|nr:glycosyltransferase family 2 protein [Candidatus Magasanikbacteria bacterium]